SGKKKTHTVKNLLIVSMIGLVLFCSRTEQGRIHDKVLAERIELRKSVTCIADLGFYGLNKAYMNLILPHKKPKGKPLSENQLSENQLLNRKRVTIEHVIGKIKVLRILKDKIRNYKKDFKHLVMKLGVQLYNFKLINSLSFCS
ncbi:MAG: transposase family protein, partial [Bacteroidia bacterium]|nr:transposase family protein [Bacteroidia bacterium]